MTRSFLASIRCLLIAPAIAMLLLASAPARAQHQGETPQQREARMAWWRQAKFGMFIHWGVYSVTAGTYKGRNLGGAWIMNRGKIPCADYQKIARQFVPTRYDPDAWAQLAVSTGMKYMVITAKHHDGFALFPSAVTTWDIADASPYGKDLIGPLAQAARAHDLHFGLYYSQSQDWNHPGGAAAGGHWDKAQDGSFDDYLKTIAVPQVKELLARYHPAIIWWDTPHMMTPKRAAMFVPLFKDYPNVITNDRLGGGFHGDFETPERHIPAAPLKDRDWETCMPINNSWAYRANDHKWKSPTELLHNLCDIVSKGGNFLLDVGPKPDGTIPSEAIDRLAVIGRWMKVNGESIYGTTATPFASNLPWGRVTTKTYGGKTTLYLQIFDWPADRVLLLPGLKNKIVGATLLAGGQTLDTQNTADGVVIHLPAQATDPIVSVARLELAGQLNVAPVLPKQNAVGALVLDTVQAQIHNVLGTHTQIKTIDDKPNIGLWTDPRVTISWNFHIDRPGPFNIIADLASPGDSIFTLTVGEQKLNVHCEKTGDYETFKPTSLGRITISRPGDYTLTIHPAATGWRAINLRQITWVPAGKTQ